MKNVKFRGKRTNSAAQIPQKNQFPRHSSGRGKLWALLISALKIHTQDMSLTKQL